MNNLTKTLNGLISNITQMELDNTKLNEDIRELEKEKEAGYKTFNTETHVLIKRDDLDDLLTSLDNLTYTTSNVNDEVEEAQSRAEEASYSARNAYDEARECFRDLEKMVDEADKEEEEPAKKKVVVSADDVADYKNMMEGGA